jgi:hypothetical protein
MPVIARYLEQHTSAGFLEVSSIFRHDFIQFLGMLQSWMVLIDAEIVVTPSENFGDYESAEVFRRDAAKLQRNVERLFNSAKKRLHPTLDEHNPHYFIQWESFYAEFGEYTHPHLKRLERATRRLTQQPAFDTVIEKSLGEAAGDETIAVLILKPYSRLYDLLDAEKFDLRVAELINDACV